MTSYSVNIKKALLCTEKKLSYRDCNIHYYTYTLDENPNQFHVSINIIVNENNKFIKSLSRHNVFHDEQEAIAYAIAEGKLYIDSGNQHGYLHAT